MNSVQQKLWLTVRTLRVPLKVQEVVLIQPLATRRTPDWKKQIYAQKNWHHKKEIEKLKLINRSLHLLRDRSLHFSKYIWTDGFQPPRNIFKLMDVRSTREWKSMLSCRYKTGEHAESWQGQLALAKLQTISRSSSHLRHNCGVDRISRQLKLEFGCKTEHMLCFCSPAQRKSVFVVVLFGIT